MGMGKEKIDFIKNALLCVFLLLSYFALAYKNPFKQNNLISNLEPFPDTFYYSVPSWNWLHGDGFKMAYEGMEINKDVPPLYGIYLLPFFKIFNDVRSYYFANLLLCFGSFFLFIRLVVKFFEKSKIKWWIGGLTGLILVTNFYFYNLPTLMMAENLQIVLILATINVLFEKFTVKSFVLSLVLGLLMFFSKMSNLPVIACLIMWNFVKIIQTKFWKTYNWKINFMIFGLLGALAFYIFWNYIYANRGAIINGSSWFSPQFFKKFFPIYLSEFLGKNGHYLWYFNQQIENIAGYLALLGIVIGLFWNKYREKTLISLSVILAMVVFHSFLYFPEGRYISVVIPLYIIFIGLIPELLSKIKLGLISVIVIVFLYLGIKQNINGFVERKATSLKRQILNNQLENNEVAWDYLAIKNYNDFFKEKDENNYLGCLLPPFNFMFFGNDNYKYLPISYQQEFGEYRGLLTQLYKGELLDYYEKLLKEGKNVYITNYFLKNNPSLWPIEIEKIFSRFNSKEVADGCLGICKIYKLELKKR